MEPSRSSPPRTLPYAPAARDAAGVLSMLLTGGNIGVLNRPRRPLRASIIVARCSMKCCHGDPLLPEGIGVQHDSRSRNLPPQDA
uniref:Uncharacterized protein n=1 Tax=Oryza punctata TaxID=4537 RepID=A0A0E0L9W1_ORYPU